MTLFLRDLKKNWITILIFNLQCIICVFFLVYMGMYHANNRQMIIGLNRISSSEVIGFDIRGFGTPVVNNATRELLKNSLSPGGNAFSFSDSLWSDSDMPLLVTVGTLDELLSIRAYDNNGINNSTTNAFIGARVKGFEIGDYISVGQAQTDRICVNGRLLNNSIVLQNSNPINLDEYIVVMLSFDDFERLYPYNISDLLLNILLVNPTNSQIDMWVKEVGQNSNIEIRPYSLNDRTERAINETRFYLKFYMCVYCSAIALVVLGLSLSLNDAISNNMREYTIHRLYGASMLDIGKRITLNYVLISLIPMLIAPIYVNQCFFEYAISTWWITILFIFTVALLSMNSTLLLQRRVFTDFVRKD